MRGKRSRDAFLSLMIVLQASKHGDQAVEQSVDPVHDLRRHRQAKNAIDHSQEHPGQQQTDCTVTHSSPPFGKLRRAFWQE